jgi:hypothetical protein
MLCDKRLVESTKLQNFLSFGPDAEEIELKCLNVLLRKMFRREGSRETAH